MSRVARGKVVVLVPRRLSGALVVPATSAASHGGGKEPSRRTCVLNSLEDFVIGSEALLMVLPYAAAVDDLVAVGRVLLVTHAAEEEAAGLAVVLEEMTSADGLDLLTTAAMTLGTRFDPQVSAARLGCVQHSIIAALCRGFHSESSVMPRFPVW